MLAPERSRLRPGLAALALGGLGLASFVAAGFQPGLLGILLMMFAWFAMRKRPRPLLEQAVSAHPEGLRLDGQLALASNRIATGFFHTSEHGQKTVRLIGKNGDSLFEARVGSKKQALELLRGLHVDVEHTGQAGQVPLVEPDTGGAHNAFKDQ